MQAIQNYVPITTAKAKLLDLIRSLHNTDEAIAITKKGVPEAVLISMEKFEGLLETIEVLADKKTIAQLQKSLQDAKHGRWVDADEVL